MKNSKCHRWTTVHTFPGIHAKLQQSFGYWAFVKFYPCQEGLEACQHFFSILNSAFQYLIMFLRTLFFGIYVQSHQNYVILCFVHIIPSKPIVFPQQDLLFLSVLQPLPPITYKTQKALYIYFLIEFTCKNYFLLLHMVLSSCIRSTLKYIFDFNPIPCKAKSYAE